MAQTPMFLVLQDIFSKPTVQRFTEALKDTSLFESERRTARRTAKQKNNILQAIQHKPQVQQIVSEIRDVLDNDELFKRYAIPNFLGSISLTRCEVDMGCDPYFDRAFIEDIRTDLSFTIFLSHYDQYEGGQLILHSSMFAQAFKLDAGSMLIYPSAFLQEVRPVESGVRLVAIGHLQSFVRSAEKRQMLYELKKSIDNLEAEPVFATVQTEPIGQLKLLYNNMLRLWSD